MKKISTSLLSTADNQVPHLLIEGELTLNTATELKESLCNYLGYTKGLNITLANVTALDLSCLQILTACQKGCQAAGKLFTIQWEAENVFTELLQKTGFGSFVTSPALAEVY